MNKVAKGLILYAVMLAITVCFATVLTLTIGNCELLIIIIIFVITLYTIITQKDAVWGFDGLNDETTEILNEQILKSSEGGTDEQK